MKTLTLFLVSFLMAFGALASGPSTDWVDTEGKGVAEGTNDNATCEMAKKKAIIDAESNYETSQWTYDFTCNQDMMGRPIPVTKSNCSCKPSSEEQLTCTYSGFFQCLETVWYD